MTEAELYKELGTLTKNKEKWKESIPYVFSLLTYDSVKIQAKALWMLGEMGLIYPQSVLASVPTIASFLDSPTFAGAGCFRIWEDRPRQLPCDRTVLGESVPLCL